MKQTTSSNKARRNSAGLRVSISKQKREEGSDGVTTNTRSNSDYQPSPTFSPPLTTQTNGFRRLYSSSSGESKCQQSPTNNVWMNMNGRAEVGKVKDEMSQLSSPISSASSSDEFARHYFPVTLGASYVLQATISDGPSATRLSESAVARGLRQPDPQPWRKGIKNGSRRQQHRGGARPGSAQSSSSSNSVSSIERMHLMTVDMPTIAGAPVLVSSPFQHELGQLRMERLRLEESHLLEVRRQEQLESMRYPLPKWYELRSPRFHYEAHKHNEHLTKHDLEHKLSNGDLHHHIYSH